MLVIRKELKVGVGIGAAVLGVAAVYGAMSLLSGAGKSEQPAPETGTETFVIGGDTPRPGLDDAVSGLPPKDEATPAAPSDPFAESARSDGSSDTDKWTIALNTGRVSTNTGANTTTETRREPAGPIFTSNPIAPANGTATISDPAPTPASTASGKYVIQPGDTFSKIAQKVYGNKHLYHYIEKANPTVNPSRLKIKSEIVIPDISSIKAERGSIEPVTEVTGTIDAAKQYRVQPGDTLSKIASKLYGRSVMWQSIYDKNRTKIGPDAGKLRVDTVLDLPESPVQ